MKYSLVIILSLLFLNCKQEKTEPLSAQTIIDNSIEISGGELIASSTIDFDFRDKHYKAFRNNGAFILDREFIDMTSKYFDTITNVKDVINNNGFQRFVNDFPITVEDSMVPRYSASVNSVHYFSVLPFGLNDLAVNKELLDDVSIKGQNYYTIIVTFNQDGGGEDFEDEFMYWINYETHTLDYLAYSYNESDGKGIRFREAYNVRHIEGVRFVDYNNYKPENTAVKLTDLPQLFENGTLKLLSKIELENITVTPN
ncbi:deoxyribose-phosphate aldolase [Flavobacteriales bacterium 33_180_T64]|nr:deoxyribose-phosphate aldolase [Flavobacteriales bacterium 33_180_T64]